MTTDRDITGAKALSKKLRHIADEADLALDFQGRRVLLYLLFLKRASDRFEEKTRALMDANDLGPAEARAHPRQEFFVPDAASWRAIDTESSSAGPAERLNAAMAALEAANLDETRETCLGGVLAPMNFMSDIGGARPTDALLDKLIREIGALDLSNRGLGDRPEILGEALEGALRASRPARRALPRDRVRADLCTPPTPELTALLMALLDPDDGDSICDPACGMGDLLVASARHIARKRDLPLRSLSFSLAGQEKRDEVWAIARLNLFLNGLGRASIARGDTLAAPGLLAQESPGQTRPARYTRVVGDLPSGRHRLESAQVEDDAFERFKLWPSFFATALFVQHVLASLAEDGRAAIAIDSVSMLGRGKDLDLCNHLVREDLIEAVIRTDERWGSVALLLNRAKAPERKGRILFIAPEDEALEPMERTWRAIETWQCWEAREKYSCIETVERVAAQGSDLDPRHYLEEAPPPPVLTDGLLAELKERLSDLDSEARDHAWRQEDLLKRFGFFSYSGGEWERIQRRLKRDKPPAQK